jgi:dTDP-4-amino-4,6-dideoxygalactose transaminase
MAVPLLDVNAQNLALESELKAAFERVLYSGQFIMGQEIAELERSIAAMVRVKHAIGVSSGTDAILLALMALGIGPGDEVLCPTFTFFATAGCIARAGALPVFVDADPHTFNLDVDDAARKVSSKTKAIFPVHLFGQCADMDPVMDLAKERGLHVIEDAAQSLGARYKGKSAGSIGTFGTFSFFPSKNLGGLGDGGMLVCNDDELAEKARLLRIHGSKPKYHHKLIGGNFRLDTLQAAFLSVKLPHYEKYTRKRQANASYYSENLNKLGGAVFDNNSTEADRTVKFILPHAMPECEHIWNQYTIRILGGARDKVRKDLTDHGIGSEIYYPIPMHRQECFSYCHAQESCPTASMLADQVLSIPIYPELSRAQQEEIITVIMSARA